MSARDLLPVDAVQFDWLDADARYGLPRALADRRPVPIFSVPGLVVPDVALDKAEWQWGRELALRVLAWNRVFYLADDGRGAHPEALRQGFPDLPQLVRLMFRREVGDAEWSFLADLDRALAHAVTSLPGGPHAALQPADLDAITQDESERRMFAILRCEEVPQLAFVDAERSGGGNGEAA